MNATLTPSRSVFGARYYTLVSSLPHLPHFRRLDRMPIPSHALDARLGMLDERDRGTLDAILAIMRWRDRPIAPDETILVRLDETVSLLPEGALRDLVLERLEIRTVLSALRRRLRGEALPRDRWGYGRWVQIIEKNWHLSDFGLGRALPWLPTAECLLREGTAFALEERLFELVWDRIGQMIEITVPFSFEHVAAYVLRWDIAERWLAYQEGDALSNFRAWVEGIVGEHAIDFQS